MTQKKPNMSMESHREIEDYAAALLARRDSGDWSAAEQAQLDGWLKESSAHRVAFLRLEAAWEAARRLKAVGAGLPAATVPPPGQWQRSPYFDSEPGMTESGGPSISRPEAPLPTYPHHHPRRWRYFAIAATVLLATAIGLYGLASDRWAGDRYTTPVGGLASVPLRDGSHIILNTATQLRVELTPRERHIRLVAGEAFFQVAHDAHRPFVVQVGHKRVIAVGTQFSVRRTGDDIRVVVTEGKVRVESEAESVQRSVGGPQPPGQSGPGEVFVTPGGIATAGDEGIVVEQRGLPAAQENLSWRQGYLTFHETSLADAAAEFNRYNLHQIRVDDPSIAAMRISGTFRALNYEAFVRVLDDGFAIHAKTTDDLTILTR
jgi:transmembrane sensor